MTKPAVRTAACAALIALAGAATAEPLRISNASPVAWIAAPPIAESSRLLESGQQRFALSTDWASHATVTVTGSEAIALDGETVALGARWRAGRGRWQWGLQVGYLFQGGGVLDNFIDEYHDLFGFPEGDRPDLARDQLDYVYRRNGNLELDIDGARSGPTDTRLTLAFQARRGDDHAVALRSMLKLPTGDAEDLAGSGVVDLALSIDGYRTFAWRSYTPSVYGGAGWLWSDGGDVLSAVRKRNVAFAHAGVAWPLNPSITLNLQFDAHSAMYDSDLPELGAALQISTGGVWHIAKDWDLAIAVVEDIATHSSPDVIFHFDLRRALN